MNMIAQAGWPAQARSKADMNSDMVAARWNQLRGDAQQKWGRLTNSDLDEIQGQANKLVGLIQDRYGYGRAKAQREVDRFLNQYGLDTGDMQEAANNMLARVQRSMNDYPWAFLAGGVILALILVGFVWKPFNR
jgi:uncharacterized protein YjbJ (UPF0337 family)